MNFVPEESFLIQDPVQSWYFYLLLFLYAAYAFARTFLGQLLAGTFMATVRYNNAASMYNDNSQLQRQRDLVLNTFYFVSIGFYAMIIFQHLNIKPYGLTDYRLFLFFTALIFVIFIAKNIVLNILGLIFENRSLFREYLYQGYAYNKLLGIIFLPVNFILIYTSGKLNDLLIYMSFSILLIIIILKAIRGLIFSFKKAVFSFYLFLYLCALEMVPLLLLYKWFASIV